MALPRLLSRPGSSPFCWERARAAHELADFTDVREYFTAQQRDIQQIDPGRLIESAFLGALPEDDLETVLITWLAVLPKGADAAKAATDLAQHLNELLAHPTSETQRRLLDLLAFVAKHKRVQSHP